jgi:hypothetical protein
MTLHEFIVLNQTDQATATWKGNFLTFREEEDYRFILYKLENFFVEVYYHKESNVIKKFKAFRAPWRLQAYFTYRLN